MNITDDEFPYRIRQNYLSPAESAFFHVLSELTKGKFVVCPKVALTDLFFVARPNENILHVNKLLRKNVDFLLLTCDSLKPALAIELDYPKQLDHRPVDGFLETLFTSTGVPIVHIKVRPTYDIVELEKLLQDAIKRSHKPKQNQSDFSPICPKCGITMVLRFGKDGPLLGTKYYGCLNYPTCLETVPVK